jgi:hypothetical protein
VIYNEEELVFHEVQKRLTELTQTKNEGLSFKEKFQQIDFLKVKVLNLKKIIDIKPKSLISQKHIS